LPTQVYGFLLLDFLVYLLFALYCDNVIANEHGVRKPYNYFLTKSYWTGKVPSRDAAADTMSVVDRTVHNPSSELDGSASSLPPQDDIDDDVLKEEKLVKENALPEGTAVKICNLNKTFPGMRPKLGKGENAHRTM
jgi:hypothetical protein